jgi:hypothetical protein
MNKLYVLVALFSLLLSVETHAAVCRLKTDGYGTFVGSGKTENVAYEQAAEKCFDSMNYIKQRKAKVAADEDQQLSFMDYCVNLSCEKS